MAFTMSFAWNIAIYHLITVVPTMFSFGRIERSVVDYKHRFLIQDFFSGPIAVRLMSILAKSEEIPAFM